MIADLMERHVSVRASLLFWSVAVSLAVHPHDYLSDPISLSLPVYGFSLDSLLALYPYDIIATTCVRAGARVSLVDFLLGFVLKIKQI